MENWRRQYRILIGVPGHEGFEIGSETNGQPLHVAFDLEKADTESSNCGDLTIWNLNDEHKAALSEDGCIVEIRAGYRSHMGPIFSGGISDTTEELQGADRAMRIELVDGLFNYDRIGKVSLNGVVTCQMAMDAITEQMEFESVVITDAARAKLAEAKYDNGYCYVGKLRAGLQKICDKAGVLFTTQNGVLQVHAQGEPISTLAYVISERTGLINIPKKIKIGDSGTSSSSTNRKEDADSESKGIPGYEIEFLVNGSIGVNDLVKMESKDLEGYFLVHSMAYKCDSHQDDWKCVAEIIEVKE